MTVLKDTLATVGRVSNVFSRTPEGPADPSLSSMTKGEEITLFLTASNLASNTYRVAVHSYENGTDLAWVPSDNDEVG